MAGQLTKEIHGGWMAVSKIMQVDIDTPIAGGANYVSIPFRSENLLNRTAEHDVQDDIVNGKHGIDEMPITRWSLEGLHGNRFIPEYAGLWLTLLLSDISTTGTDPYTHVCEIDKATNLKKFRTVWVHDGVSTFEYIGITCSEFKVSISQGEAFAQCEATLIGRGSEDISAETEPTKQTQQYMRFTDADVNIKGTWNGTAYSGGSSIKTLISEFEATINDNGGIQDVNYQAGGLTDDGDGALQSQVYRGRLDYPITFKFLHMTDVTRSDMADGDTFAMQMKLENGDFKLELVWPKVQYRLAPKTADDGRRYYEPEITPLEDDLYNPCIAIIKDDFASYEA